MPGHVDFFILLSFIVLVPIVPAYLLFKVLPSTGNVTGTFKGMEIKLGGSFAGYFALVLLIIGYLPRIKDVVNPATTEVWDVDGQVVDENGKGIQPLSPSDIKIQPDSLYIGGDGWFTATITTKVTKTGMGLQFPTFFISHKDFSDQHIVLNPPHTKGDAGHEVTRDEQNHYIRLKAVVLGKPSTPYSPAGAPPPPADPSAYAAATKKNEQGGQTQ